MGAIRRVGARLGAVGLILAASLPGPLQLVHRHAGGGHVHVHADAERLAAHDLFEEHATGHSHGHSHRHPHAASSRRDPAAPGPRRDGPVVGGGSDRHVHGLNPFQLAARTVVSVGATSVAVVRPIGAVSRAARLRARHTAKPRGPPGVLVG